MLEITGHKLSTRKSLTRFQIKKIIVESFYTLLLRKNVGPKTYSKEF